MKLGLGKELRASALLFLMFFVVAYLSLTFSQSAGRVAAIWPANAVLFVALIKAPRASVGWRLAAGWLGNLAANVTTGDTLPHAIALSLLNAAEVSLCYFVIARRSKAPVDLTDPKHLIDFLIIGAAVAPALSGLAAAGFLSLYEGAPFVATATTWWVADALGMIIFAPPLLILAEHGTRQLLSPKTMGQTGLLFAILLAGLCVVFLQSRFPLLYLIPPILMLITFRLGLAGGAWGVLITSVFSIVALLAGHGPETLVGSDTGLRVQTLQAFLAFMALTTLPLASTLSMRRQFETSLQSERQVAQEAADRLGEANAVATMAETMASVGYWVYRPEKDELVWSNEMYRIYGFSPDGGPRRLDAVIARIHPDDRSTAAACFQRLSEQGEAYEIALRIVDGDEIRPVLFSGRAIAAQPGAPSSLLGVMIDKTRLTRIEDALVESEARYRQLAALFPDLVVRLAPDGRITYASPASRRYGYEPEDLVGLSSKDLIHPDDLAAAEARTLENFTGHGIDPNLRREQRVRTATGEWIWMEGNPVQVKDDNGKVLEVVNVFRDVTRRRELEDSLQAALSTAEKALRIKGDFLSNMSHELRTPLTAIIGFSGLLRGSGNLEDRQALFATRIDSAAKSLLSLVNDILDIAKLDAGGMIVEQQPVNLATLLDESIAMVSTQAATKGLALDLVAPDHLTGFVGDANRTRQVLVNLLNNAVKFTASGTVRLTVLQPFDHTLRFSVSDTGPGIDGTDLARLFERFTQADSSSARAHGGTGLGLAISKGLVTLMGGALSVESEVGVGSTFSFTLPVSPARATPDLSRDRANSLSA